MTNFKKSPERFFVADVNFRITELQKKWLGRSSHNNSSILRALIDKEIVNSTQGVSNASK
jgi:hypothetical protein